MRAPRSTIAATGLVMVITAGLGSCSSGDEESADTPPTAQAGTDVLLLVPGDHTNAVADVAFADVPELLITVDGQVIFGVPASAAVDGELVIDVWANQLTPTGIDMVRTSIDEGTAPDSPTALARLVGAELGSTKFLVPDTYRFRAIAVGPVDDFDNPDTPLVDWPDTASIALADAEGCTILPELEVGEAFETAAADSAFVDDGVVYGVVAAQNWPSAGC